MLKKTKIVFGPSFPNLIPTKKKWNPLNFPKKKKNYEKKNIEIERKKNFFNFWLQSCLFKSHYTYCVLLLYYYWLLWFIFNINDGDTLFLIITLKSVKSKWKKKMKRKIVKTLLIIITTFLHRKPNTKKEWNPAWWLHDNFIGYYCLVIRKKRIVTTEKKPN